MLGQAHQHCHHLRLYMGGRAVVGDEIEARFNQPGSYSEGSTHDLPPNDAKRGHYNPTPRSTSQTVVSPSLNHHRIFTSSARLFPRSCVKPHIKHGDPNATRSTSAVSQFRTDNVS